jgi:hypothetical protein
VILSYWHHAILEYLLHGIDIAGSNCYCSSFGAFTGRPYTFTFNSPISNFPSPSSIQPLPNLSSSPTIFSHISLLPPLTLTNPPHSANPPPTPMNTTSVLLGACLSIGSWYYEGDEGLATTQLFIPPPLG